MRSRTIKPSFFKNEQLADVSFQGRLLFQGLWCLADRNGVLENRHRRIKAEVFPYDEADIPEMLAMLSGAGLVRLYESKEGVALIQVTSFQKHQNPHPKEKCLDISGHGAVKINDKPLNSEAGNLHLPVSCSLSPVSCSNVYGGAGAPASPSKYDFASALLRKHNQPIPENLTLEEADKIIDTLKNAQVSIGPRAPDSFPDDPDPTPEDRALAVEAHRKATA